MRESDRPDADVDRRLELQNEIDSILAEIGERRRKEARSWIVALVSVVVVALIYARDFIGLPTEVVMLGATLVMFVTVGSAVWAMMSSIGFFTSAKERLDKLMVRLNS